MDVRGLQITRACAEESPDSGASLLSRSMRAFSDEVASCRPQALAACALSDAGTLNKSSRLSYLFCYNQKCSSGISANSSKQDATVKAVAFCHFWLGKPKPLPLINADEERSGDRKVNPGVESAKSLFFGVEVGEGWVVIADIACNRRDPKERTYRG